MLQVIIRLAEVRASQPDQPAEKRMTFRSAAERKNDKVDEHGFSKLPPAKVYARPDVRVGDTIRVRGRVDEWQRRTESIRQVSIDEASGTGSICEVVYGEC